MAGFTSLGRKSSARHSPDSTRNPRYTSPVTTNGHASAKCQLSPPASQPPSRAHSGKPEGKRPESKGFGTG